MADEKLTPNDVLARLSQGPINDPNLTAFAAGQMSEGVPASLIESIQHEKSVIRDLITLLKNILHGDSS